jgi:CelD/BcsL family acetyltransferase involved in cellulose biosynthesis
MRNDFNRPNTLMAIAEAWKDALRMQAPAQAPLSRTSAARPNRSLAGQDLHAGRTATESGASAIRTVRLDGWESLPDLEAAWSDLLARCGSDSVFQTLAWHVCWWRAFRDSHELFVILAFKAEELVGIAPMMITRQAGLLGGMRSHVRFIGSSNHASDYCDFIVDAGVPQALPALLDAINVGAGGFDRLDLSHFPSHSPNKPVFLEYLRGRDARFTVEFQAEAPVRMLGDTQADRKAANKSSLKRHTKFFEKSGELRFHQCASEPEILGYLDAFFDQHKARRARTDSPSQFFDPAQQLFYRELVTQAFRYGWLRFDVVLFDGAPLAFHFGFEYRRRFIWYKPAFDVRFAAKSPGEVLLKFLLDDAIDKALEEFDFTVGSESFKHRFATLTRSNDRIIVFRTAGDYWVHRGLTRGKSMLKNLLRRGTAARNAEPA